MTSFFFSFLVICITALSVMAIDNCAISPATLKATGNTCIDLSLCPSAGGPPPICPFIYFPACGCDGETYTNSCYANLNGVSSFTRGECGAPPLPIIPSV